MPREMTEEVLARRRTRPSFEKAQVRKIFTLPERLVQALEEGCDLYDITESEFVRRLLLCYVLDNHQQGELTRGMDSLDRVATGRTVPLAAPAPRSTAPRVSLDLLFARMSAAEEEAEAAALAAKEPFDSRSVALSYFMDHPEELLAGLDAWAAGRTRKAGAA